MWSLARQLLVGSLAVWSVAAEISVSVEAIRDDGVDFSSDIKLVPVPPRERWQHGTRHPTHPTRGGSSKRDTISYSGNWCGASQHSTAKDPIVSAFSYFTAPNLSLRKGIPPPQYAAAWVGVDGAECKQALLQAGATTVVNSNGGQSAWAWWQWYPAASYKIDNLPVKPGDWMSISVTVLSPTSGKLVITNAQQGYEVAITVTGGPRLCQLDAEWLVEDFYDPDDGQVNFARFSDLWFLEAQAKTASGKTIGIDGAAMVYLQNENGTIVCKAEKWDNANFVAISP